MSVYRFKSPTARKNINNVSIFEQKKRNFWTLYPKGKVLA